MSPKQLFDRFLGHWHFSRVLKNQLKGGVSGDVSGTAVFSKTDDLTILYQEQGLFTTNRGDHTKIYQEYVYQYCENQGVIEKFFSKSGKPTRLFYPLDLRFDLEHALVKAQAAHQCGPDQYQAEYTFFGNHLIKCFDLVYDVSGPKKLYNSSTSYFLE